ncbi:MAG TPA: FAD-dependent oxidoreductase [Microvirga sp.]|nr:FAD-dependent oxidoreductase [Microvirga sp.]
METLTPDLCVIGAGSAGLSVAAIAASFGVPVVLVERGRMGGECLNVGCVPSKALIAAGDRRHAALSAGAFGVEAGRPEVDFARVREHVRLTIAAIEPNDSAERFTALGVRVIAAEARFTGPDRVAAGGHLVKARRFVIATGSAPAIPPIPGLDAVPVLTNETVFDLAERPRRLLVIGGGPIGIELAQAHRRLGAEVTVVEAAPRILAREDPEMAAVVERALLREGVELRVGASIARVEPRPEGVAVVLGEGGEAIEGSHLLVAAGRRPVTEGLGLEAAGIAVDKGGIVVDQGLRTANRRVYAIGDCAGGAVAPYRFTHVSNYHAGLVVRSALFRLPVRVDTSAIPRVTFTDPELAAVGLSEEEARARHRAIRILRWPFAENDRAQAERTVAGHVKAIVTPRGRVLGCAIAGPQAGELIVPWALAVQKGLKAQDLAGLVFPYPTLSEVTKRAAVEFLRPAAQNPWLRRLIGVARRFG